MVDTTLRFFNKLSKGKVNFIDSNLIEWILGDMILIFNDNNGKQIIRVCWKKWNRELTHLHIVDEDIEQFIKEIDNEQKAILVKNCLLWCEFKIIDKSKIKKQTFLRHYSI